MEAAEIATVTEIIRRAMNDEEADQARCTFDFHFSCAGHGLDDGRSYFVLDEERVLGIVGLHRYLWGPPENVWLGWFAVDPNAWGRGLGRLLLEKTIEKAQQLGYMKLFIETYSTPEFARARAFYTGRGFRCAGSINSYLPDGGDMVVYCRELTHAA